MKYGLHMCSFVLAGQTDVWIYQIYYIIISLLVALALFW